MLPIPTLVLQNYTSAELEPCTHGQPMCWSDSAPRAVTEIPTKRPIPLCSASIRGRLNTPVCGRHPSDITFPYAGSAWRACIVFSQLGTSAMRLTPLYIFTFLGSHLIDLSPTIVHDAATHAMRHAYRTHSYIFTLTKATKLLSRTSEGRR